MSRIATGLSIYGACRINNFEYSFNGTSYIKTSAFQPYGNDVESGQRYEGLVRKSLLEMIIDPANHISWDTQDLEEDQLNFIIWYKSERHSCESISNFRNTIKKLLSNF